MIFDNACIVGVGLIGGSFGMAVRERGLVGNVIGAVRREATINQAIQCGAVDSATTDLALAARDADLIFMAPPVGQMERLCRELAPHIREGATITDGGSTKSVIVESCAPIFDEKAYFVGGHPMAGSEQTGVEAARADLFEKAIWVLTPTPQTPRLILDNLVTLVEGLGATPLLLNAEAHDALLAITSHLPHITAAALVHLFAAARDEAEVAQQLIAGGWRDSTRVAAGSPEMWRDICLANSSAILRGLDALVEQLVTVRTLLEQENGERLLEWFDEASVARRKQGYRPRLSD